LRFRTKKMTTNEDAHNMMIWWSLIRNETAMPTHMQKNFSLLESALCKSKNSVCW